MIIRRRSLVLGCSISLLLALAALLPGKDRPGADTAADLEALRRKPITTIPGPVGELLRGWWKEGTAAGNAGDWYDNRDGDHSPLDLTPYPQLRKLVYTPDDVKVRRNWAAQRELLPGVVFGNSSTSAPPEGGGSNPRSYYSFPAGVHFLSRQYRANNLYIYPEHRDHDPGHNGRPDGYGDLYPTNTSYLIISQGSSGSDQPFMRALPFTLAALRPAVKERLTEAGLLMPTIQMILRRTNRHLKGPGDYLTGKAHPTVFEGSWVDAEAMVRLAHALEPAALPPLVQLEVLEEDRPAPGVDFFEPAGVTEALADTPCAIARVFRGKDRTRRLVVSAAGSLDLNKAPLTYTWVVLRGDPEKIAIRPRNKERSVVELVVPYTERRPISPGSALASNRVDIGVFAHNGTYHSAPAFVTFFSLDREARTYDERGRVLEVAHGLGETTLTVADWPKMLDRLMSDGSAADLLRLTAAQRRALPEAARGYAKVNAEAQAAQKALAAREAEQRARETAAKEAEARFQRVEKLLQLKAIDSQEGVVNDRKLAASLRAEVEEGRKTVEAARTRLTQARKAVEDLLRRRDEGLAGSLADVVEGQLRRLARDPAFWAARWDPEQRTLDRADPAGMKRIEPHRRALKRWGLIGEDGGLRPLRPGPGLWTAFEKAQLELFHARALAEQIFPGLLTVTYQVNYVDPRLSAPREWRDVYRHDRAGQLLGWTRYQADGPAEFNHEGLLVVEKDDQGRCLKGRPVRYERDPAREKGPNRNPLRAVPGGPDVAYEFAGPDDLRGSRIRAEP